MTRRDWQILLSVGIILLGASIFLLALEVYGEPPPNFHLAFDSAFRGGLSVSDWGPAGAGGSTWIAHTPYAGDFGSAWFGIQDGSETTVNASGQLQIKAWYDPSASHWRSGCIASVDPNGNGFSASGIQYWEARIQMPLNAWPSVWLLGVNKMAHTFPVAEIDFVEAYADPLHFSQTTHRWNADGSDTGTGVVWPGILSTWPGQWITVAVLVWTDFTYFYVNDIQTAAFKTDPSYLSANFVLVDLAIPGGTPGNPIYMLVDYVRCYLPN